MSVESSIIQALNEHFHPVALEVINESHLHAGHRHGGVDSHFAVSIVSSAFSGKTHVARHRMVYECLDPFIKASVHALKIKAKTPEESQ